MLNFSDICISLEAETGVNPMYAYCSVTGKPYATTHYEELILAFGHLTDADEAKSEMLVATLAAMRPAPSVSSLTPASLNRLRLSQPRMLLSYLLSRYYAVRDNQSTYGDKHTFYDRCKIHRARINLWRVIQSMPISELRLNQLLLALLQLDSRFNLSNVAPPRDMLGALIACDSDKAYENYILIVQEQFDSMTAKKLKDERQAIMSAEYWSRGNKLTTRATLEQFLVVTPPTPMRAAKQEKVKKENDFLSALESLMAPTPTPTPTPAPKAEPKAEATSTAVKPKGIIAPGGLRLNIARRA